MIGDYPEAMVNYDLVLSGLIQLVQHSFNKGLDHSGPEIGEAKSFFVASVLHPFISDSELEMRVQKKINFGTRAIHLLK